MSDRTPGRTRGQAGRGLRWTSSRGRLVTGGIGALGILCAASTTIWPTRIEAVRTPEVAGVTQGFEHRIWSWGREAVYSADGVQFDAYSGPTPTLTLVFLVVVLLLGAAGVAAWLLLPDRRGGMLGAAGVALAAAAVGASVAARLAIDDRRLGLEPGLVVVTPVAGWLEYAAALLLAVALALMLVLELVPRALPKLAEVPGRLVRALAQGSGREAAGDDADGTRRVAVIRDVQPSDDAAAQGSSGRAGTDAEAVGFSDNVAE
ncbi:hypothetical protein ACWEOW_04935 [Monashia sp. NPDC004114]